MNAKPFLAKFARPIPSDSTKTGTSESPESVKEKSQNRRLSTIMTKVARETTDDR